MITEEEEADLRALLEKYAQLEPGEPLIKGVRFILMQWGANSDSRKLWRDNDANIDRKLTESGIEFGDVCADEKARIISDKFKSLNAALEQAITHGKITLPDETDRRTVPEITEDHVMIDDESHEMRSEDAHHAPELAAFIRNSPTCLPHSTR